ncbi:MAG: hypothetical protein JNN07_17470 [Verrucomicrobiales bacterium]|nr:hypothetical protein [Verrucomicrobiales bacterium]
MHCDFCFWRWFPHPWRWGLILLSGILVGCGPNRGENDEAARRALPPVPHPAPLADSWGDAGSVWVETALSPALLLHTAAREVRFFVPESAQSPTVPRYLAFGANGPKLVTNGTPAEVSKMQERWILLWFGETKGWEQGDCPLGIFLQHPLQELVFDSGGLTLRFSGPAGDITVMPLYGARGLPVSAADLAALPLSREERRKLPRVWEWTKSVPRDPLTRLRYWSSVLARYPYGAWGCWGHDPLKPELLGLYAAFDQHEIPFTWPISPLVLSPIPTGLAEVTRLKPSPLSTSRTVFDMDWPGLKAPLYAVPEAAHYSIQRGEAPGGVPEFKASVAQVVHLADRIQGQVTLHAEGWREWTFDREFIGDTHRSVLRLDPLSSLVEWGQNNQAQVARRSLGQVWLDGVRPDRWDVRAINSNTRVFRSMPSR